MKEERKANGSRNISAKERARRLKAFQALYDENGHLTAKGLAELKPKKKSKNEFDEYKVNPALNPFKDPDGIVEEKFKSLSWVSQLLLQRMWQRREGTGKPLSFNQICQFMLMCRIIHPDLIPPIRIQNVGESINQLRRAGFVLKDPFEVVSIQQIKNGAQKGDVTTGDKNKSLAQITAENPFFFTDPKPRTLENWLDPDPETDTSPNEAEPELFWDEDPEWTIEDLESDLESDLEDEADEELRAQIDSNLDALHRDQCARAQGWGYPGGINPTPYYP